MARGRRNITSAFSALHGAPDSVAVPLPEDSRPRLDPMRVADGATLRAADLATMECDPRRRGTVISLAGTDVVVDDGALTAEGLAQLTREAITPDGVIAEFADGHIARVSANHARCTCAHAPCAHRMAAIALQMAGTDVQLDDALARLRAGDSDALAVAASRARTLLGDGEDWVHLRESDGEEPARGRRAHSAVSAYLQAAGLFSDLEAVSGDAYTDEDLAHALSEMAGDNPEASSRIAQALGDGDRAALEQMADAVDGDARLQAARNRTARTLGLEIPDPDEAFVVDQNIREANVLVKNALMMGRRSFGFYGPQGTGKSYFAREIAGALRMPLLEIDMSAGDDMEMLIGTTGLKDGETVAEWGVLSQAACAPGGAVISMAEVVEVPRGQLTALHNMIGSGFRLDDRSIVIKSPSGERKTAKVSPHTVFVLTWNPDRADRRPHPALQSRLTNIAFGHGTDEEETERLSTMVHQMIGARMGWEPGEEERPDASGEMIRVPMQQRLPDLGAEAARDVAFFRELRRLHEQDALSHPPDLRTMAVFTAQRMLEQDAPDAVLLAARTLDFFFDQSLPEDERWEQLERVLADHYPEVIDAPAASPPAGES